MSLRPFALLVLSLACAACAGDPEPAPGDGGTALERKHGPFSGTWVRTLDDGGSYTFEVYDDGETIRGELTAGLPADCLSYVFDLERGDEGALAGSSLVRFEEPDGGLPTSYSTQWSDVRLEDGDVVVNQQWIQTDEFGDVAEQGFAEIRYDFTPYVSEAERAAAWAEALSRVEAPHRLEVGPEAGIGMGVVQLKGQVDSPTAWALMLVDEDEDAWHVELTGGPLLAHEPLVGAVMGLTVHKQSGHVTRAVVGKPGTAGDPIAVSQETIPRAEAFEGTPEELTVAGGTFASEKVESRHGTSWVGTEGEAEGILLKWEGEDVAYELAQPLELGEVTLADGRSLPATTATYTNGLVWTLTNDPIVRTFFPYDQGTRKGLWGFLVFDLAIDTSSHLREEVIELRDDASPQLDWSKAAPAGQEDGEGAGDE